jgi:hypothetical protein
MSCIVSAWKPGRVVMAADRMGTMADAQGAISTTTGNSCKIRRAGRWQFSVAGFDHVADGVRVRDVLEKAIAPATGFFLALRDARRAYYETIHPIAKAASTLAGFRRMFPQGCRILNIHLAGVENGVPALGGLAFELVSLNPFTVRDYWTSAPGALVGPDERAFLACAPSAEPLTALLEQRPRPDWLMQADEDAARRLVELQADASPEAVGGAIDVITVTVDTRKH